MPKEEIVTTLDEINEQIRGDADEEKVIDLDAPLDDSPPPKKGRPKEKVEIEIVDDTPAEDRGRKPMKTPPKEEEDPDLIAIANDKVQQRIDELKRAWHDERRAKEKLEREQNEAVIYAKKLVDENKKLFKQLSAGEKVLMQEAQKGAEYALKAAKRTLQEAQESGDSDKVVEAMSEITRVTMDQENWKKYEPQYKEEDLEKLSAASTLQTENNDVAYQQSVQKPVPPDEKALSWYNKNTWFGVDDERTAFAYGLHQKLVREGLDPRTDEYYERIDARLRQVFPDQYEGTSQAEDSDSVKRVEKRQQATVVAPATRTTPSKKVVLTKTQVALARRLGVPLEVYAKHVAMQQENR
jgi:hypothetical protein